MPDTSQPFVQLSVREGATELIKYIPTKEAVYNLVVTHVANHNNNQIAHQLSFDKKLNRIEMPNVIYGTDADGRDFYYSVDGLSPIDEIRLLGVTQAIQTIANRGIIDLTDVVTLSTVGQQINGKKYFAADLELTSSANLRVNGNTFLRNIKINEASEIIGLGQESIKIGSANTARQIILGGGVEATAGTTVDFSKVNTGAILVPTIVQGEVSLTDNRAASLGYVKSSIAAAKIGELKWLPSVLTFDALPTYEEIVDMGKEPDIHSFLCRVMQSTFNGDTQQGIQGVYLRPAGIDANWDLFSDESEFVNELELAKAIKSLYKQASIFRYNKENEGDIDPVDIGSLTIKLVRENALELPTYLEGIAPIYNPKFTGDISVAGSISASGKLILVNSSDVDPETPAAASAYTSGGLYVAKSAYINNTLTAKKHVVEADTLLKGNSIIGTAGVDGNDSPNYLAVNSLISKDLKLAVGKELELTRQTASNRYYASEKQVVDRTTFPLTNVVWFEGTYVTGVAFEGLSDTTLHNNTIVDVIALVSGVAVPPNHPVTIILEESGDKITDSKLDCPSFPESVITTKKLSLTNAKAFKLIIGANEEADEVVLKIQESESIYYSKRLRIINMPTLHGDTLFDGDMVVSSIQRLDVTNMTPTALTKMKTATWYWGLDYANSSVDHTAAVSYSKQFNEDAVGYPIKVIITAEDHDSSIVYESTEAVTEENATVL